MEVNEKSKVSWVVSLWSRHGTSLQDAQDRANPVRRGTRDEL